ncbi:uncharacterized protein RBU33_025291 [Hipposideros larvatus]
MREILRRLQRLVPTQRPDWDPTTDAEYLIQPESHQVSSQALLQEFQDLYPLVWAESNPPGLAAHQTPIVVTLKPSATPIAIRQYPIKSEARIKISHHIRRLLDAGILRPCTSPWNTPLLPVLKADTQDYRPVQDLREVNKRVETIHPTVPNPYTLLSLLPPDHQIYTVLDLKDAFFSIPLAPPRLRFQKETTLNPATLLPDSDPAAPLHHCLEVISQTCLVRPDLTDVPLPEPDEVFFTDGSSYVRDGVRYAGAAVVSLTGEVRWAQALPRGSSAQKAELIALTQALRIGKDKAINIYTDSRYTFATVHVHGEIYKNRGLLTSEGRAIKNKEEILALLEAIWDPKAVAVIHCRGHQKDISPEAIGNQAADQAAREAAIRPVGPINIMTTQLLEYLPKNPTYTTEEHHSFLSQHAHLQPDG